MLFYDIHTHSLSSGKDIISIFNRSVGEFGSFCGLDLQHQLYSLGLHPWKIREDNLSKGIDFIEKNSIFDSIKAIGECGLDKLCDTPWNLQEKALIAQIKISESIQKPLIIHCVKAFDELIAFKKEIKPHQSWIIHGYRGKPEQANQLISNGFYLSFGSKFNEESIKVIPLERIFLETDDSGESIESVYGSVTKNLEIDLDILQQRIRENINLHFKI